MIITQGEYGDTVYYIESGKLECYIKKDNEEPKCVKKYQEGDTFGELALLYNTVRAASIIASTDCVLWELDRETFNNIVRDAAFKKRQKYVKFLQSCYIFENYDEYELSQFCDAIKVANYKSGDYVIKEGEVGNLFYLIEEGEAVATRTFESETSPRKVKNYKKGDYFGELALLNNESRKANVIATTNLKLLCLDKQSFNRLLGPVKYKMNEESKKYINKI